MIVGTGFFGRVIAGRLRRRGIVPIVASRSRGHLRIDVEDRASVARALQPGDIVVDTAGPFQRRTVALAEVAIARGCDVIDLSDARSYAQAVLRLHEPAVRAGVRVFTSCSAVAAVAAAAIRADGAAPDACDLFLAPASAETGNPATVRAFLASVDWTRSRPFPRDSRIGWRVDSAAAVLLPRAWPALKRVDFWVDPNAPFAAATLSAAARFAVVAAAVPYVAPLAGRVLGRRAGLFAVAVGDGGRETVTRIGAPRASYLIAAEPAVLVAESLRRGADVAAGVVPIDRHVAPDVLFARFADLGVSVSRLE